MKFLAIILAVFLILGVCSSSLAQTDTTTRAPRTHPGHSGKPSHSRKPSHSSGKDHSGRPNNGTGHSHGTWTGSRRSRTTGATTIAA